MEWIGSEDSYNKLQLGWSLGIVVIFVVGNKKGLQVTTFYYKKSKPRPK